MLRVRNDGIPVVGFTWYSLTDQVDWDTALREDNGHVNPLGLFDLDRRIRPVGAAYKQLIADWREVLPTRACACRCPSSCPRSTGGEWAQRQRAEARNTAVETNTSPANSDSAGGTGMRFKEKVAIVTGGASGIGLATARRLGSEGRSRHRRRPRCRKRRAAAEQVRAAGALDAVALPCDVAREDQVQATVTAAFDRFGRLDGVVNNAGLMLFQPIAELTGEDWMRVLHVDLLGAFYFTKHAFLRMAPGGAIVNVSSIHALETSPLVACYAAAKAALLSLTRTAALEGKPKGIRVNAILPGAIDTPMLWENPNVKSGAETIDPADVGRPEDIAAVIAYLALRRRAVRAGRDGAGRRRAPQSPLTPLRRLGRSHPTRPRAACQLI